MDRHLRLLPLHHRSRPGRCCSTGRCGSGPLYRMLLILPWAVPGFRRRLRLAADAQRQRRRARRRPAASSACRAWTGSASRCRPKISVIMVNVWLGVPFMMVAILGGLQAIPRELYEAAEVDGATPWQRFRQRHAARAATGVRHGDPARHHLDVQPVPGHLPGHRAAARAARPTSWSPRPTRRRSTGVQNFAVAVDLRRDHPVHAAWSSRRSTAGSCSADPRRRMTQSCSIARRRKHRRRRIRRGRGKRSARRVGAAAGASVALHADADRRIVHRGLPGRWIVLTSLKTTARDLGAAGASSAASASPTTARSSATRFRPLVPQLGDRGGRHHRARRLRRRQRRATPSPGCASPAAAR